MSRPNNPNDARSTNAPRSESLSRRDLLTGAVGAAGVLTASAALAAPPAAEGKAAKKPTVPTSVLGKTGMKVSRLAHGGAWDIDPEVLGAGFEAGINYLDTAEAYGGGQSETACGEFLTSIGATGKSEKRKKLWLVTKTGAHRNMEARLPGSLARLKQDYVDCYYMHGINDPRLPADADIKAMARRMKDSGKIRFFGFSCHDGRVVECLNAAADSDFIDVVMFRYDAHYYKRDDLERAMDRCAKAKIGLVAMKTQVGGMTFADKYNVFKQRGLNQHTAAIKAVAADERIHAICSEMTTTDVVKQNLEAVAGKLTLSEADAIKEHARMMSHLWCRGCDNICRAASGEGASVAVADSLRFLMYHDHYGKPERARRLFAELPAEQRDLDALSAGDWASAERACPHNVPLQKLMTRVKERLA